MKTIQFIYNNNEVDFLNPGNENVMVNATQMAKIFEKRVDVFTKSDHTKSFILELELTPFGGRSEPLKREEIIKTINGVSTWMHRILALKFAAWLDVKFELWVFSTIDQIILGAYADHRQATIEKLQAEQRIEKKKEELLLKYPEFEEFLNLQNSLSQAQQKRNKAIRNSLMQLKLNFFKDEEK